MKSKLTIYFALIVLLLLNACQNTSINPGKHNLGADIPSKELRFCRNCKTIEDAYKYEKSLGADEIKLTHQQVIELFIKGDYSRYNIIRDTVPYTYKDGLGYVFFTRQNSEGMTEVIMYEYIYPEKRNYKSEYDLLTFASTEIFDYHPSVRLGRPIVHYTDTVHRLYDAYLEYLKKEYNKSGYHTTLIQLNYSFYKSTTQGKPEYDQTIKQVLTTFHTFCCGNRSTVQGYGMRTKMPLDYYFVDPTKPNSEFYVPMKKDEDYLKYHYRNPPFYLVNENDLALGFGIIFNNTFEKVSRNYRPVNCPENCE